MDSSGVLQVCGGFLMTPLMYHTYMGTTNENVKISTILGLGMLTSSLLPAPPIVEEGDTGAQMMFTTVSFCVKSAFIVGIGISLMNYIVRH